MGGKDRPLLELVEWRDIVIDAEAEQELRELIGLLNDPNSGPVENSSSDRSPVGRPSGSGKKPTGKTDCHSDTEKLYPVMASDLLGSQVGESVKSSQCIRACERQLPFDHFL